MGLWPVHRKYWEGRVSCAVTGPQPAPGAGPAGCNKMGWGGVGWAPGPYDGGNAAWAARWGQRPRNTLEEGGAT